MEPASRLSRTGAMGMQTAEPASRSTLYAFIAMAIVAAAIVASAAAGLRAGPMPGDGGADTLWGIAAR